MREQIKRRVFKKANIPPYIIYIILAAVIALILFLSVHKILDATLPH